MSTYTERARALRPYIVKSAASLTDADASLAPELFTRLTGSGRPSRRGVSRNRSAYPPAASTSPVAPPAGA